VRIRADQLKKIAATRKVSREQLAQAITRPGLKDEDAVTAVRNWSMGRNHPRARKGDIAALAGALGVAPKDIAKFTSEVRYHRGSPRKADLLVDLVRGKKVEEALNLLTFSTKRAAVNVKKCLAAAIADAEQNDADVTNLVVSEARIDDAPRIKRFNQKDRGRAHQILKRLTHITVSVQERA
jgi:large subunit ribosomal protein L22